MTKTFVKAALLILSLYPLDGFCQYYKTVVYPDGSRYTYGSSNFGTFNTYYHPSSGGASGGSSGGYYRPSRYDRQQRRWAAKQAKWDAQAAKEQLLADAYNNKNRIAVQLFEEGNYLAADSVLASVSVVAPNQSDYDLSHRANFYRVVLDYSSGNYDKLIRHYNDIFAVWNWSGNPPKNTITPFMDDPANQSALFRRNSLSLFEQFQLEALYTVAICNRNSKKDGLDYWNKVFRYFYPRLVSSLSPADRDQINDLAATVFKACGQPEKSIRFYNAIIKGASDKLQAREKICSILNSNISDHDTQDYFSRQLDTLESAYRSPKDSVLLQQVILQKASLYEEQKKYVEADRLASTVRANRALYVAAMYVRARCAYFTGEYEKCYALLFLPEFLKDQQYRDLTMENILRGDAKLKLNDIGMAIAHYDAATQDIKHVDFVNSIENDPDLAVVATKKSFALLQQGNLAEAKQLLEQTISTYPKETAPLVLLGNIYLLDKNKKGAAKCFRQAKALGYELNAEQLSTL